MPAFSRLLARDRPGEAALVDGERTFGWAEVDSILNRAAANLLCADLGPSRRVAVFAENAAETAFAHLGGLLGGASTVPVSFHLTATETAYILRESDSRILFVGPETASRAVAVALVIDTTSSAASLLLEAAARREVPVAYVTGLAMRRAADLYAGAAKTDPKDAAVLADYARRNADRLSWTTPSDELLARLRILNGRDADLAADATRAANRLRDALLTVSPALERAVGDKLSSSGGARDALARWGTPTALRDAGKARVRTRIAKRSPRTAQRLTDAIWGALDAQSVTVTAEATWWRRALPE